MLYAAEDLQYLLSDAAASLREKAAKLSGGIAALTKHLRS
jgi:hypothetical protein